MYLRSHMRAPRARIFLYMLMLMPTISKLQRASHGILRSSKILVVVLTFELCEEREHAQFLRDSLLLMW